MNASGQQHPPFLILGLPRSRTYWLSRFLSYGDWHCGHEELRHARSMEDIRSWLAQPNTGTSETAAAPWWRLLQTLRPDMRIVTIRRDPAEVLDSLRRTNAMPDSPDRLRVLRKLDAKLDQIERRWPNVMSVRYADLEREETCQRIFERCLPYAHDSRHWAAMADQNLQIDLRALWRYAVTHLPQMQKLARAAHYLTIRDMRPSEALPDGITIQEEPFDASYQDATDHMKMHMIVTDQDVLDFQRKNIDLMRRMNAAGRLLVMTARSNGRLFGYLISVHGLGFDSPTDIVAQHMAFYASPDVPGLGRKLAAAMNGALRQRGVVGVIGRASIRGTGPRLGALWRRLGGQPLGELYWMDLKELV